MSASKFAIIQIGGGEFKYNDYYLSRELPNIKPINCETLPIDVNELYNLIINFKQPINEINIKEMIDCCPFKDIE